MMPKTLKTNINGIPFSANYFAPKPFENGCTQNTLLFCLPGGGASAEYFNLTPENSFVQKMTLRGYDVITMDHPGTVTNPLPVDHSFLTPQTSADYIAQALSGFQSQLNMKHSRVFGIGHSMGGMMTTLVQARHTPFDGIALLGSSAGGLEWGLTDEEKTYIDDPFSFARDIEKLTLAKFKIPFPQSTGGPSGKSIVFGGETAELTQRLRDVSCELYAAGGMMSMTRGSFRQEVNAIDVPLFFAFGDHDIGIPPKDVPKDYINAPRTELVILENTGHNHFAFSSLETLCTQIDQWATDLD